MTDVKLLDQVYHHVIGSFGERGRAPHFTELARDFSVSPERGRELLPELLATGVPGWLHPDTDLLASLGPFNNLPTMYRISVDGEERCYGQ